MYQIMKNNRPWIRRSIWMAWIGAISISCHNSHVESNPEVVVSDTVYIPASFVTDGAVVLGLPRMHTFLDKVQATGLVDVPPQNIANISSITEAYVKEIKVIPGNHVHKGDVLFVLHHPRIIELQQDYLQSVSKQDVLEKELIRQKTLIDNNIGALKELQNAASEYSMAKATVSTIEAKLKLLGISTSKIKEGQIVTEIKITSPIHGDVKSVFCTLGKYVSPTDVLAEIIDNSHMHLELKVFEKDILKVKKGQKIRFNLIANPADTFTAEVYLVGKTLNNPSGTALVHAHLLDDTRYTLLTGMYVSASIITHSKKSLCIPLDAIFSQNNESYCYRYTGKTKDGRYSFVPYKISVDVKEGTHAALNGYFALDTIAIAGSNYILSERNKNEEE